MKVLYFHRFAQSGFHIHSFSSAEGFYLPEKNLVLFKEGHGTFGGSTCSLTQKPEFLEELQGVLEGKSPEDSAIKYSKIKEFDYDDAKLLSLVESTQAKDALEEKVESGIGELDKFAGKLPVKKSPLLAYNVLEHLCEESSVYNFANKIGFHAHSAALNLGWFKGSINLGLNVVGFGPTLFKRRAARYLRDGFAIDFVKNFNETSLKGFEERGSIYWKGLGHLYMTDDCSSAKFEPEHGLALSQTPPRLFENIEAAATLQTISKLAVEAGILNCVSYTRNDEAEEVLDGKMEELVPQLYDAVIRYIKIGLDNAAPIDLQFGTLHRNNGSIALVFPEEFSKSIKSKLS